MEDKGANVDLCELLRNRRADIEVVSASFIDSGNQELDEEEIEYVHEAIEQIKTVIGSFDFRGGVSL